MRAKTKRLYGMGSGAALAETEKSKQRFGGLSPFNSRNEA